MIKEHVCLCVNPPVRFSWTAAITKEYVGQSFKIREDILGLVYKFIEV